MVQAVRELDRYSKSEIEECSELLKYIYAVSYTHLDVYKRQLQGTQYLFQDQTRFLLFLWYGDNKGLN